MKFGINLLLWTIHVEEKHFPLFEKLKKAGYNGVEVPLCFGDENHYRKVSRAINDAGLECTCTSNGSAEKNIISSEASVRRAGLDHIKWATDMAQLLGSRILAGPIHCAPGVFSGNAPTDVEFQWSAENLRSAAEYAAQAELTICPEFLNRFECYLSNTVEQSVRLSEAVDHPNYGIHYDTHHAHYEENDIAAAIKLGDRHIKHVHFSESHRGIPGSGLVDWQQNVEALRSIGYRDWITLEAFSGKVEGLRQALHIWRDFFLSEEECYLQGIDQLRLLWQSEHLSFPRLKTRTNKPLDSCLFFYPDNEKTRTNKLKR